MKEITIEELQQLKEKHKVALYLYTPICGTCTIASKMMEVVEQLLPTATINKMNLNYNEQIAYDLQIESVPCFIIMEKDIVHEKIYAFQSVPYLYEKLQKYFN